MLYMYLHLQLMRLYAKYREAEVHRKALVFQKNYFKSQVDAFFQTQQAALVIMADMGAPAVNTPKAKSKGNYIPVKIQESSACCNGCSAFSVCCSSETSIHSVILKPYCERKKQCACYFCY